MDENERERERASRFSRRLYFNGSSLKPSLKLSSFQRQYHDHIDSKVIPDSFQLTTFIKFTFPFEFSFLVPQLDLFHSLARRYIGISINLLQFSSWDRTSPKIKHRRLFYLHIYLKHNTDIFSDYKDDKVFCHYEIILICKTIIVAQIIIARPTCIKQ